MTTLLEKLQKALDPRTRKERKVARQDRYIEKQTSRQRDKPGNQYGHHGEGGGGGGSG